MYRAHVHEISYENSLAVYFGGCHVISEQQANYLSCIPRKEAPLTALPTVCWLLIAAGEEGGCCWTPEQVPSLGLVLTWVLLRARDGSLHGTLAHWQLQHMMSRLSAKDC